MAKTSALDTPQRLEKLIALHLEGRSTREIAAALSTKREPVTFQRVAAALRRHAGEIAARRREVAQVVKSATIAQASERMAVYDAIVADCDRRIADIDALLAKRGSLEVMEPKVIGQGENAERIEVWRFDASLLRERERLQSLKLRTLEQASLELGQRPRPPALVVQDNRNQVNVSVYEVQRRVIKALELEAPEEVVRELRRLMPPPAEGDT